MRAHQHLGIQIIVTFQCFASPFHVTFKSYDFRYVSVYHFFFVK